MRNCSVGNKLVYADEAAKIIRKLRTADRRRRGSDAEEEPRLVGATGKGLTPRSLFELSDNPDLGKNLTGPLSGLNSLRTGKYRIIYRHNPAEKTVFVLTLGHRKDIYRRTRRKRKQ